MNGAGGGMEGRTVHIEIVFAPSTGLWRQALELPEGTTVGEAVQASDFARVFPEYAEPMPALGIYGERCTPQRLLSPGDRIEVYRPLVFDPLESRRRRALHRKTSKGVPPG
jgi:putative ubiquitin-RnfH superfamily antitoxin RatB of RatAB toxin-antitoxin module